MPHHEHTRGKSMQNLIQFLLKENIDNSIEIAKLHSIIQDHVSMDKDDSKNLDKQTNKLCDKIDKNIELLKRFSDENYIK